MDYCELHDWHYGVNMGCGVDSWQLTGRVYGHPNVSLGGQVFTSTPKKFDRENMIVETASGRKYKLFNCAGKLEEQIKHIEDDIAKGGTQHW